MKLLRLALVPFAFIIVGVARLLYPRVHIRFGEIWVHRLGHLIGNTECYLSERDDGRHKAFDIFTPYGGRISHKTIYRKYRKSLHMMPATLGEVVIKVNATFNGWNRHFAAPAQVDRDIYNLWAKHGPHLSFTEREERKGQRLLRDLGIAEGTKWVCFFVRDSAYLKAKAPGADFSYHDYRDSDISECIPTALELVRRGYYVIRMGEIVAKPFHVKHSMVIDYSLSKHLSDFGSLYLGAKCAFAIGSHSGWMSIPQAFNRPIAIINYAPLEYLATFANGLAIWKHHLKDGKRMTVQEIAASGLGVCTVGQLFTQAGVTLQDNTSQEIYELAMEMCDWIEGKIAYNKYWNPQLDQALFWENWPRSMVNNKPLHGEITLRIGREFLKGYQ